MAWLSDHYGVAVTVSPANAPPRGPGLWSTLPANISHPAFKTLMTAQMQTFLQANPVTTTLSRAARWDKLKVDIQDVAGNYCSTFHAQRTRQLRVLKVRASQARAAYVAAPGSPTAPCRRCALPARPDRGPGCCAGCRSVHTPGCRAEVCSSSCCNALGLCCEAVEA